jgi:lipopolysaccharide transport system ATP-binding protein
LGTVSTGTVVHDLNRWWVTTILHKDDPYQKIGDINDRTKRGAADYVWSLKDINFHVEEGDVFGIIGNNGAGKSTLLKILSRVTSPTTGHIAVRGRVASLLEVGTGFHPEMTGRENIFMNGALLGMTKREIACKFDQIVHFSGCERYIDTPVKRYSSGMTVRLGFAVAAYLESDILVVDEVLAVGDMEFQKKAIETLQHVSRGQGRTVLFVSHNMAAVRNICQHALLLENGCIKRIGETQHILDEYLSYNSLFRSGDSMFSEDRRGNGKVRFRRVFVTNTEGRELSSVFTGSDVVFHFEVEAKQSCRMNLGFAFHQADGTRLSNLYSGYQGLFIPLSPGIHTVSCKVSNFSFVLPELYVMGLIIVDGQTADWPRNPIAKLQVEQGDYYGSGFHSQSGNTFLFQGDWHVDDEKLKR